MISVICCYNKLCEYEKMLESLRKQDITYEIIGVKNDTGKFGSAASALNWGASKASGNILVFLHQNVVFQKSDSLRRLTEILISCNQSCCIVGAYGAAHKQRESTGEITVVDTLDECCVAMTRENWTRFMFDEKFCNGWHLYVVDLCIRIRQAGGMVLTGDFDIQHLSGGNVDESYMKLYKQLLIRYKEEKWIATTCKSMPTNLAWYYAHYFLWKIKKRLLGNYPLSYKIKKMFGK